VGLGHIQENIGFLAAWPIWLLIMAAMSGDGAHCILGAAFSLSFLSALFLGLFLLYIQILFQ
jgi:hypothetical protein